MRRILFALVVLTVGAFSFAQTSAPGVGGKYTDPALTPHYNYAHQWIAVEAPLPGQVAFTVPQVEFILDPAHIVPENLLTLQIRVLNNSDRPISLSDDGLAGSDLVALGFEIGASTLVLQPNQEGWFTYTIRMPTEAEMNALFNMARDGTLAITTPGGGGYEPDTGHLRAVTRIVAVGINGPADTSAVFGF